MMTGHGQPADGGVLSPSEVRHRNRRLVAIAVVAIAVGASFVLVTIVAGLFAWGLATGAIEWDERFYITVHNDTASTVHLMEPCVGCAVKLQPVATLAPGESFELNFSNASSWTYVIEQEDATTSGCLPFVFSRTPPAEQRTAEVSSQQECPGDGSTPLH